ncbi:MAG: hypothetical protein L7U87_07795 [Chlamydiales bacterium]|nr:hypothetical protein [Chlamydiales bacterium]
MKSLDPLKDPFTVTVSSRDFRGQKIIILTSSKPVDELSHAATDRHVLITPTAVLIDLARHTLRQQEDEALDASERSSLLPRELTAEDIRESISRIESYLYEPSIASKAKTSSVSGESPPRGFPAVGRARLSLHRRRPPSLGGSPSSRLSVLRMDVGKLRGAPGSMVGAVSLETPVAAVATPPSSITLPAREPMPLEGCWILCTDDDLMARRLLTRNFDVEKTSAARLDAAENGREAIDKVKAYVNKYEEEHEGNFSAFPTGLITMDSTMPLCSGPEAVVAIDSFLKSKGIRSKVFIVGITANTTEEELASFKSKGLDAVLPKPIIVPKVVEIFRDLKLIAESMARRSEAEAP